MIIASDIHLKEGTEETVFNEVLPGLFEATKQNKEKTIALLGDIYHLRYKVDVRIQNRLREVLKVWTDEGIRVKILPGNHDQIDLAGRNALEVFGDIRHVEVYTEPTVDGDGLWIPYRKNNDDIKAAIAWGQSRAMNLSGLRVCFMHHGVLGAMMNDHMRDTDGLNGEEFFGFDTVFCGHYHKRQSFMNVHYVGSTYQTKADESGQDKGYAIWDGEEVEFVNTDWGKRYHRFELGPNEALNLEGVAETDIVRVRAKSGVDPKAVAHALTQAGITDHVVTPDVEPLQTRLDVPENAGLLQYATAYVEAQDTHLDKNRLMKIYGSIVGST